MIDRDQLRRHVQDALAHIYDAAYLMGHPLARLVGPSSDLEQPGVVLRRMLLDSLQELKPPPDSPSDTWAAHRYQFLYLRYVRDKPMDEIGRRLALSQRQLYRRQHDALEDLVTILAGKLAALSDGEGASTSVSAAEENPEPPATDVAVQQEVARIGSGRPPVLVDLAEVTRGAVETVSGLARERGVSVALQVQEALPPISGDKAAIRQAVLSLFVFAIGAADSTAVRASLRSDSTAVTLGVEIDVQSPAARDELDRDSNLSVGRRLTELQGGALRLETGDGHLLVEATWPAAHPRTVLVVDDNPDTLRLFTRFLEASGYRIVVASTGEDAVRALDEIAVDAVVLDVMLPSADGWEVLHVLRSQPELADLPVVVCTVLNQEDLARSLGATEFVRKPVTQACLLGALDRCWARTRQASPGTP